MRRVNARRAAPHAGRAPVLACAVSVTAGLPATAFAHTGELADGRIDPLVLGLLAVSAAAYGLGTVRLWRHAGRGRGVRASHLLGFGAGWAVLVIALLSPVDALGSRSFAWHMVQHELLMAVAAPLLVLSRPLGAWAWALAPRWRALIAQRAFGQAAWRRAWHALQQPLAAWWLHALVLWLWHVPAAFDAALRHEGLHTFQHLGFTGSALLYWWSVLRAAERAPGVAMASLFSTLLHTGALGALLVMAPGPWYGGYVAVLGSTATALDDQHLGGLLMWVPAGLVYVAAALAIVQRRLLQPAPSRWRVAVSGGGS